ncbi:MAG: hypothetical protein LBB88_06805 [Planctomycetaceae bacterium]|nr:hypothetical protein [Planctomycetaceae bacterium]
MNMSIYELQLDQKITKTHWRLSRRRRGSCYNRSNFIKNIRSDNLTCQYFLDSKNGRSFVTSVGTVLSSKAVD